MTQPPKVLSVEFCLSTANECEELLQQWLLGRITDDQLMAGRRSLAARVEGAAIEGSGSRVAPLAVRAAQAEEALGDAFQRVGAARLATVTLAQATIGGDDVAGLRRAAFNSLISGRGTPPWSLYPRRL